MAIKEDSVSIAKPFLPKVVPEPRLLSLRKWMLIVVPYVFLQQLKLVLRAKFYTRAAFRFRRTLLGNVTEHILLARNGGIVMPSWIPTLTTPHSPHLASETANIG
jgi:hypothetical protein